MDVFKIDTPRNLVKLSYIGYPGDTGICRRISDEYTEINNVVSKPLKLPRSFLCYLNSESTYQVHQRNTLKRITFGCFAKLRKINVRVRQVFIKILQENPNSRLILKSKFFHDIKLQKRWKENFNPVSNRVLLLRGPEDPQEHRRMFSLLDIHLDTFPYSGTTISAEALWMNVPIITKTGHSHVERVTASFLTNMGHPDLVAQSEVEYQTIAKKLHDDILSGDGCRDIRLDFLRMNDPKTFMRNYESLFSCALSAIASDSD